MTTTTLIKKIEESLGRDLTVNEVNTFTVLSRRITYPAYFDKWSAVIPLSNINRNTDSIIQGGKQIKHSKLDPNKEAVIIRYSGSCHVYLPIPSLMNA